MNKEQMYAHMGKRGVSEDTFKRMVTLMFYAADLCDSLSVELEEILKPYGTIDVPIKTNVKKVKEASGKLVRICDLSLVGNSAEVFAADAGRFKNIAYGWGRIKEQEKPFLFSDMRRIFSAITDNGLKVMTLDQINDLINRAEIDLKAEYGE